MKSDTLFFALLRDALWHTGQDIPTSLSDKEGEGVLLLAKQQTLSGLIIDALFRHNVKIPQPMVFESIGLLERIKQNNGLVNGGIARLNGLLAEPGVPYIIVKGQVVATYYPDPLLRQAGDIDFYCDKLYFEKARKLINEEWGINASAGGSDKHIEFSYKDVIYEGHFSLISLYSRRNNSYWQKILNEDKELLVNIDGVDVKTLSPTLHALYIFLHLYHHLMELGVGLRQFCDWAMMLHACQDDIDLGLLHSHLQALKMEKAYRACGSILVDYLGLPEHELGYQLTDNDRRYGRKILDVVFYRGNMGHYNKLSGRKHKIEAIGIKASHFFKFMPLAPSYSCHWLWHEFRRKVV